MATKCIKYHNPDADESGYKNLPLLNFEVRWSRTEEYSKQDNG